MSVDKIGAVGAQAVSQGQKLTGAKASEDFLSLLKGSMDNVNKMQLNAEAAMEQLATGKAEDIHRVMIAVEEANLSFMTMMQIRNKLIDAYNELMRMQM